MEKKDATPMLILSVVFIVAIVGIILVLSSPGTEEVQNSKNYVGQAYIQKDAGKAATECYSDSQCGTAYDTDTHKCNRNNVQKLRMYPSCTHGSCSWYGSWFTETKCAGATPYCKEGECTSTPTAKNMR